MEGVQANRQEIPVALGPATLYGHVYMCAVCVCICDEWLCSEAIREKAFSSSLGSVPSTALCPSGFCCQLPLRYESTDRWSSWLG